MKNIAVEVDKISKKYQLGERGYRSLREDISRLFKLKKSRQKESFLWALKGVSFQLKKGEGLGIVGPNGSGKSTLLKILANVTSPTAGSFYIEGKQSALIELTAGFHPELTGRENIYLYGSIKGMKKIEVENKFDEIVSFSELENYIDTPIKRYSSGMHARLGFAVSSHVNPDILIIDEVLSVGDVSFQRKCLDYMRNIRKSDKAIIFVSHNLSAVERLCDRVIWLDKGEIKDEGKPDTVIKNYTQNMYSRSQAMRDTNFIGGKTRWGSGEARINRVLVLNSEGKESNTFLVGDEMRIRLEFETYKEIDSPTFWVGIINEDEIRVSGACYNKERAGFYTINGKGVFECIFRHLIVMPGIYHLMVGIFDEFGQLAYDRIGRVNTFRVKFEFKKGFEKYRSYGAQGIVSFENEWRRVR